jgi:excisionase family DNA binding protein
MPSTLVNTLTISEYAKREGVSPTWVAHKIKMGDLKYTMDGFGHYRIPAGAKMIRRTRGAKKRGFASVAIDGAMK